MEDLELDENSLKSSVRVCSRHFSEADPSKLLCLSLGKHLLLLLGKIQEPKESKQEMNNKAFTHKAGHLPVFLDQLLKAEFLILLYLRESQTLSLMQPVLLSPSSRQLTLQSNKLFNALTPRAGFINKALLTHVKAENKRL